MPLALWEPSASRLPRVPGMLYRKAIVLLIPFPLLSASQIELISPGGRVPVWRLARRCKSYIRIHPDQIDVNGTVPRHSSSAASDKVRKTRKRFIPRDLAPVVWNNATGVLAGWQLMETYRNFIATSCQSLQTLHWTSLTSVTGHRIACGTMDRVAGMVRRQQ